MILFFLNKAWVRVSHNIDALWHVLQAQILLSSKFKKLHGNQNWMAFFSVDV